MIFFCKSLLVTIFLIFLDFFYLGTAWAAPEADTKAISSQYNITYNILENGQTEVVLLGELQNLNQNVYVSAYSLLLDQIDPQNVEASDARGPIIPQVETVGKVNKISLNFNDKIIGSGRPLSFRLSYNSKRIAQKNGLVWEINIPKAADYKNVSKYEVAINVPNTFGPIIYLSPKPDLVEKKLTKTLYKYNTESISKTGAILSFGENQIYSFNLKYNLKNNNFFTGLARIALPPSIFSQQEVIYDEIYPLPLNVETDNDGNYIASYKVPAGKVFTISVKGQAKILNSVRDVFKSGTFAEIPTSLSIYTHPQKYWETESPEIEKIVNNIAGQISPQSLVAVVAQKLFDFTVNNLTYDENRIKPDLARLGALEALKNNKSAVCMEFADLYVTLLRRAGIPAQLLEGFAYTTGVSNRPVVGDVLHSWVRLYIPRLGWLAVDPTWSNTTGGLDYFSHLDTNHFIFSIKGSDSETPYPAGAYKISPDQVGDIEVKLSSEANSPTPAPEVSAVIYPQSTIWSNNKNLTLEINNLGKSSIFGAKIYLIPGLFKNSDSTIDFSDLPALGKKSLALEARSNIPKNSSVGRVSFVTFSGEVKSQEIQSTDKSHKSSGDGSNWLVIFFGILGVLGLYSFAVWRLWKKPAPKR